MQKVCIDTSVPVLALTVKCHLNSVKSLLKLAVFCVICLGTVLESIAVSSKQVREILRSKLSTSVPVTSPSSAMETNYSQATPLSQRLRDGEHKQKLATEDMHSHGSATQPGMPFAILPFNDFVYIHEYMHLTRFLNNKIKALYFF